MVRMLAHCLLVAFIYANDIALLSPSCFGLQKLLNIYEQFASTVI